ncbi:MAG: rhodanese-like domain-containing protein [Desulfovibrio sp.]|nr:rhodanese-like domain-containing protein [Desulfovibrio sp.]
MFPSKLCLILSIIAITCLLETLVYLKFGVHTPQTETQTFLSAEEAHRFLADNSDTLVVDVRSPMEFMAKHSPNSINIPLYRLPLEASYFRPNKPVLLVDVGGMRAYQAYWTLRRIRPDISRVYYIRGWLWEQEKK